MSDLPCRFCREPWDHDSLHLEAEERNRDHINTRPGAATFVQVAAEFRKFGCGAMTTFTGKYDVNGSGHMTLNKCAGATPNPVVSAVYDLLGDDTDGAANMLEDAEAWGLL